MAKKAKLDDSTFAVESNNPASALREATHKVTKSNALIEASYKMTLNEQRLVLLCISQLDPRKPLPKDNLFTVSARDFSTSFNIEEKHAYEALEDAANTLYERDIKTFDGRNRERFRWVFYVKYHDGAGKVTMGFSPFIAPYLTMLSKKFTSYHLRQVAELRSVYSIRLFEMLMQFKDTGKLNLSLDKFKERLELADQYPRFFDLKRRVIEPAVQELQEKSDLLIEWDAVKKGRNIDRLQFRFKQQDQMALQLS